VTFTEGAAALAMLGPDRIRLNCVPAINLFPVNVDAR
jgi:type VI protein secretion system component VasA